MKVGKVLLFTGLAAGVTAAAYIIYRRSGSNSISADGSKVIDPRLVIAPGTTSITGKPGSQTLPGIQTGKNLLFS